MNAQNMNYQNSNFAFRPVQCTETSIKDKTATNGFLYFTTDSKKIYLGKNGKFLPMGGNSGIYYGNRVALDGETDSEVTIFSFILGLEIEGDQVPNVDDLILNIPDGGFYRVTGQNIDAGVIIAEKLAVAGGGNISGGSKPNILGLNTNPTFFSLNEPDRMYITFSANSLLTENNYIDVVEYKIGTQIFNDDKDYQFGEEIKFDFSKYLKYLNTQGDNTVYITIQDAWGNRSYQRGVSIKIFNLQLSSSTKSIIKFNANDETLIYDYKPDGGDNEGLKRYLELSIAPLENPGNSKIIATQPISSLGSSLGIAIHFPTVAQQHNIEFDHGVYVLTAIYKAYSEEENALLVSNTLQHQIAYLKDPAIPLIATSFINEQIINQYSEYRLEYLVAEGSTNREIEVLFYVDDNNSIPEKTNLNTASEWKYTFTEVGTYTIYISYNGMKQRLGNLNVIKYSSDDIPTVDQSLCELNLIAAGKANTHSNREEWTWKDGGNTYVAQFENFLWGQENGWLRAPDGDPALKLTNGAKLTIPNYRPFAKDAIATGLTIEVDFMLSKVSNYSKPLISCLSNTFKTVNGETVVDSVSTGFQITGQKATLNSKNYKATTTVIEGSEDSEGNVSESDMALQAFTQYFNEDTRIHLTYVIEKYLGGAGEFYFVYTYMNGVLSGIMKLDSSDAFIENPVNPAIFTFDSTYGDIYIYSIRVIRQAINSNLVIKHWLADINNVDTKIKLYKHNNILNTSSRVDKQAIDQMSVALGVPYVVFEGGIPMPKKFKKKNLTDPTNSVENGGYHPNGYTFNSLDCQLPTTKTDFRLMSMKMYDKSSDGTVKTLLDIPMELEDASKDENNLINDFDDINANGKYWFNRGVQVYGQGTSSMVYPVKNLRLKFLDSKDYPTVYDGSVPVEIICFKADYMDSAASHNTCTGNLVYDLYDSLGLKTPPQIFKSANDYDIVTAIKGFPIICFYRNYNPGESGHTDEYIYIGRYNFNLDKATPEPFGFPGMMRYTKETVNDDQGRERKVVEVCGLVTEEVNGKQVLPLDEEGKEQKIELTQCWEVLNNDTNSPTKFLTPEKVGGGRYLDYEDALRQVWNEYYEDRYPDEIKGIKEDADDSLSNYPQYEQALEDGLFRMSLWVNSTAKAEANPNRVLPEPVFYLTMHSEPKENTTYYDSNKNIVNLVAEDAIYVEVNNSINKSIEKDDVTVNINTFKQKVNNIYDSYTFSYSKENGWSLFIATEDSTDTINVNLNDYGISVTSASLHDGQTIIIELYRGWRGWNPDQLYEKHTHDTEAYRLAKFKNEFRDYFDMQFSLFYYVLTLTLLMMDSRAKNMMLASWDTKIWYPIFYDMDTMLGLNNVGFNKFSYDTEDDPKDMVFNGYDSVLWNNFRECFEKEISQFYVTLRDKMTFNKLIETYNTRGANAWNEALITRDAIYKYERPFEKGYYDGKDGKWILPGEKSYLYAAQGRRSNHREWWLKNRLTYLDSKYKPTALGSEKPSSDIFSFRAYGLPSQKSSDQALACVGQTPANHKFDLTALTNSYQSLFIGNIVYGPEYTLANQTKRLGPKTPKHEVESYILNASLIADLGDLSNKYIGSWSMSPNKLTALKFGRSSRSHGQYINDKGEVVKGQYINEDGKVVNAAYDLYFNSLLTELTINNDLIPYLNYLNIARCTGLANLDVSTCNKLEIVDAEGANKLANITFPQDSILKEVYLPRTLKSLQIKNQPHLKILEFDPYNGTNKLDLPDGFELINVSGVNTYPIAKEVFNTTNGVRYALTGINWVIDDIPAGEITKIPILETLINNKTQFIPKEGYSLASAVTGTIKIDGKDANNKLIINEFDLYNEYKSIFPDLSFTFGENVVLTAAATIQFRSSNDITDTMVHYEVLCDPSKKLNLDVLTSVSGPTGIALTIPARASSISHDYVFNGYWFDKADPTKVYYSDLKEPDGSEPNAKHFKDFIPAIDTILIPGYSNKPRIYEVVFQDDNGKIIPQEDKDGNQLQAWPVTYGHKYDGPMKNYYYKDEELLSLEEKYTFLGWSTARNAVQPTFVDPTNLTVEGSITLYAYFKKESVKLTPAKLDYFTVTNGLIKLKDEYKNVLQGKITLPLQDANKRFITGVANNGFKDAPYITHIFFQEISGQNSQYTSIGQDAFTITSTGVSSLKYVALPNGIVNLGERAFQGCYALEEIILPDSITAIERDCFSAFLSWNKTMKVKINSLPENLTTLGVQAFWNSGPNIKFTYIPSGVTSIPTGCFYNCSSLVIEEFGTDNGIGLETISGSAFEKAGSQVTPAFDRVIFRKSVRDIKLPDPNNATSRSAFRDSYIARAGITVEIHNEELWNKYGQVNQFVGGSFSEPKVEYSVS